MSTPPALAQVSLKIAKFSLRGARILNKLRSIQANGLVSLASRRIQVCAQEFLEFYVFKQMNREFLMRVIFLRPFPRVSRELQG